MRDRLLNHLRQNLVAYVALFVALGGTSYATVTINGRRIRNHTIDAVKLNPRTIASSVRAWANLQFNGTIIKATASSSPVTVTTLSNGERITWQHPNFGSRCVVSATPQINRTPGAQTGVITAEFSPRHREVELDGVSSAGVGRPQAAFVIVLCP